MTIDQSRLARVMDPSFYLRDGKGAGINGKMDACAQQALRYILGLDSASDDCPPCVSPVIHAFSMNLNDKMPQECRNRLKNYLVMQTGTRGSVDLEIRRAFKLADHAVRFTAANALETAGLKEKAVQLRSLPEIIDKETSYAASDAASDAARYAASAASDAARYAASAASDARYAASDARYAASAAARYAASAAARYARYAVSDAWEAELTLLQQLCEMTD